MDTDYTQALKCCCDCNFLSTSFIWDQPSTTFLPNFLHELHQLIFSLRYVDFISVWRDYAVQLINSLNSFNCAMFAKLQRNPNECSVARALLLTDSSGDLPLIYNAWGLTIFDAFYWSCARPRVTTSLSRGSRLSNGTWHYSCGRSRHGRLLNRSANSIRQERNGRFVENNIGCNHVNGSWFDNLLVSVGCIALKSSWSL